MPVTGDGATDDRAAIQALIDDATNTGYVVEIPWAGQGTYKIGSPGLNLPGRVKLRGEGEFNTVLFSNGSHAAINITEGTGQGGEAHDWEIRDMAVTNASTGKAITSVVNCQGRIADVRTGAGGIAIDLPGQHIYIDRLQVYMNTDYGGLLGNTMLKLTGSNNHVRGLVTQQSVRTGAGWTNASPVVWFQDGTNNSMTECYIETTWGNGQTGFNLKVDNAGLSMFGSAFEPHLSGTGAVTSSRAMTVTTSSLVIASGIGSLGDNGSIEQGKLYVDATSAVHIDYWGILTSLSNVLEIVSGGRVSGNVLATTGSTYANTSQVRFSRYVTSAGRLTEAVTSINRVRRD